MRPAPGPSQRPSGHQQSPYPPARTRAVTQSQSGDHPDPSPPSATGLRIFSCRVGVARDLLSENMNTPFSVMFRIYGSLVNITSPEACHRRNKNRKYLIISDLSANNLRIRCFFQVLYQLFIYGPTGGVFAYFFFYFRVFEQIRSLLVLIKYPI